VLPPLGRRTAGQHHQERFRFTIEFCLRARTCLFAQSRIEPASQRRHRVRGTLVRSTCDAAATLWSKAPSLACGSVRAQRTTWAGPLPWRMSKRRRTQPSSLNSTRYVCGRIDSSRREEARAAFVAPPQRRSTSSRPGSHERP
jgi:hypothetical protein